MKEQTIKAMVDKGVPAERAAKIWEMFQTRCNAGDEVTTGDVAVLTDETIREKMSDNPTGAEHLILALRGAKPAEDKKGRKFKPGKSYSPDELAAFYVSEPENPDLLSAIAKITLEPWVIALGGKYDPVASARYLNWYRDDEIPPATVMVAGVPVAPVMPGKEHAKEAKKHWIDPHTPGGFLNVELASPRTGASFKGYVNGEDDSALSAMIYLFPLKLSRMDDLALQNHVDAYRGKSAAEILGKFPAVLAEWNKLKPEQRPSTKGEKPKAGGFEPLRPTEAGAGKMGSAAGDSLPLIYVMTGREKAWEMLKEHLSQVEAMGRARIVADVDMPPGAHMEDWQAFHENKASAIIVLLSAGTISLPRVRAAAQRAWGEGRKVFPVLVRSCCLDGGIFDGLARFPKHGRAMQGDADAAEIATEFYKIAGGLLTVKPVSMGEPAWLSKVPPDWSDANLQAFHEACCNAYSPARAEQICKEIRLNVRDIYFGNGPSVVWEAVINAACGAGKLRALYDKVRADAAAKAYFADWR